MRHLQPQQVIGRRLAETTAEAILNNPPLLEIILAARLQNMTHEKIVHLHLADIMNVTLPIAVSALSIVTKQLPEDIREKITTKTHYVLTYEDRSRGGTNANKANASIEGVRARGNFVWDEKSDAMLMEALEDVSCRLQDSKKGKFSWPRAAEIFNSRMQLIHPLSYVACRNRFYKIRKRNTKGKSGELQDLIQDS
jgi:hypothetical protein